MPAKKRFSLAVQRCVQVRAALDPERSAARSAALEACDAVVAAVAPALIAASPTKLGQLRDVMRKVGLDVAAIGPTIVWRLQDLGVLERGKQRTITLNAAKVPAVPADARRASDPALIVLADAQAQRRAKRKEVPRGKRRRG